jgi:hypothetical protein
MFRLLFHRIPVIPPLLPFMMVFSAVIMLSVASLMAEEEEWRFVYESEGINVHKRIKEGSRFLEFKVAGDLRGEISEYVCVLLDTDNMPDWAPQCFEARNVERVNERETIIYVACNGVWPVADRDYFAKRTITSDRKASTVSVDIDLAENPGAPDIKGRVRIPHLQCRWILKRIDPVNTHVELRVCVDPGGWLPAWLVNWGYRWVPYRYLKDLESKAVKLSRCTTQLVSTLTPHTLDVLSD